MDFICLYFIFLPLFQWIKKTCILQKYSKCEIVQLNPQEDSPEDVENASVGKTDNNYELLKNQG